MFRKKAGYVLKGEEMNIKFFKPLIAVILMCLCICSVFVISYAADETLEAEVAADVTMDIVANNVSYSDSLYILYAINNEGFDRTKHEIKMLFWDEAQESYALGTEKYSVTNSGTAKVKGKNCLIFYSNGIAAKEMTDDIFARACVVIEGREYYSDVMKFSVLEYVHAMKEQGNIGNGQIKLFTSMLDYGTAAQNSFGHNTSRPANGEYHKVSVKGGKLPDGFDNGRYLTGEKVVITPDEPAPGMRFSHWVDEDGIIVSFDKELEITVGKKSKEYIAIYKDISNIVTQLMLKGEIAYNDDIEDVDLPTAVTFEINGESVTLEVAWDTATFESSKIGKQNIYAELVDTSAYATYGIDPGSIVFEVNTLPYAYELDSSNGEYVFTGYYGDAESVTIPSVYRNIYISRIASKAFNRVMTLKEVIVPDTVKKIDNGAFFYCDNIEKITLPFMGESATSSNSWFGWIFGAASYDIQNGLLPINLETVNLYDGAKAIPDYAFYKCDQIKSFNMPDSITSIGRRAFYNCSLTEFTLPSGLRSVRESFLGCSGLKRVNVSNLNDLFSLSINSSSSGGGSSVFAMGADLYCNGKLVTEISIPNGITTVSNALFQGCTSVKRIYIPSSVKYIGMGAFNYMTSLESVVFEEGSVISELDYTFSNCPNLSNVNLEVLTSLESMTSTFSNCSALSQISFPGSVKDLGNYTFKGTAITSIVLPDGIQQIGTYMFAGCKELEYVEIPAGVVEIGEGAFLSCSSLNRIVLPAGLVIIESQAFQNSAVTDITIPERVSKIGSHAFYGCSDLVRVTVLSKRITEIGTDAFAACKKLYEVYNLSSIEIEIGSTENGYLGFYAKVIHTDLEETSCINIDSDGFIIYSSDDENILIGYIGEDADITLPETTINGKSYSIAADAFYNNEDIKTLVISDGVISIGGYAFYGCTNLTSITIGNSVTNIGDCAFYACSNLSNVTFKNSDGWKRTINSDFTGGTAISAESLQNKETAAKYLKSTYCGYYWYRNQ